MIYLGRGLVINTFRSSLKLLKPQLLLQGRREICQKLQAFKALQAKFQADDGKPIWLKGGLSDSILYNSTLLGSAAGIIGVFHTIRWFAIPPSWRKESCNC